jgi:hypothetical protein
MNRSRVVRQKKLRPAKQKRQFIQRRLAADGYDTPRIGRAKLGREFFFIARATDHDLPRKTRRKKPRPLLKMLDGPALQFPISPGMHHRIRLALSHALRRQDRAQPPGSLGARVKIHRAAVRLGAQRLDELQIIIDAVQKRGRHPDRARKKCFFGGYGADAVGDAG